MEHGIDEENSVNLSQVSLVTERGGDWGREREVRNEQERERHKYVGAASCWTKE